MPTIIKVLLYGPGALTANTEPTQHEITVQDDLKLIGSKKLNNELRDQGYDFPPGHLEKLVAHADMSFGIRKPWPEDWQALKKKHPCRATGIKGWTLRANLIQEELEYLATARKFVDEKNVQEIRRKDATDDGRKFDASTHIRVNWNPIFPKQKPFDPQITEADKNIWETLNGAREQSVSLDDNKVADLFEWVLEQFELVAKGSKEYLKSIQEKPDEKNELRPKVNEKLAGLMGWWYRLTLEKWEDADEDESEDEDQSEDEDESEDKALASIILHVPIGILMEDEKGAVTGKLTVPFLNKTSQDEMESRAYIEGYHGYPFPQSTLRDWTVYSQWLFWSNAVFNRVRRHTTGNMSTHKPCSWPFAGKDALDDAQALKSKKSSRNYGSGVLVFLPRKSEELSEKQIEIHVLETREQEKLLLQRIPRRPSGGDEDLEHAMVIRVGNFMLHTGRKPSKFAMLLTHGSFRPEVEFTNEPIGVETHFYVKNGTPNTFPAAWKVVRGENDSPTATSIAAATARVWNYRLGELRNRPKELKDGTELLEYAGTRKAWEQREQAPDLPNWDWWTVARGVTDMNHFIEAIRPYKYEKLYFLCCRMSPQYVEEDHIFKTFGFGFPQEEE